MSITYSQRPDSRTAVVSEATPTVRLAEKQRMEGIDVCRFVASTGVVWLHCCTIAEWASLGRFRMPFFITLSSFLVCYSVYRRPERTIFSYLRDRSLRILIPFWFWVFVYLAGPFIAALLRHKPMPPHIRIESFIFGVFHLWFLPFIFIVTVFGFLFAKLSAKWPKYVMLWVALGFAAFGAGLFWHYRDWKLDESIGFTWAKFYLGYVLPMPFGVVLAILFRHWHDKVMSRLWRLCLIVGGGLCWITFIVIELPPFPVRWLYGNLAGVGLVYLALTLPKIPRLEPIASLGRLSYGVYLTHGLFCIPWRIWDLGLSPWSLSIGRFSTALVGGTLAAYVLGRIKWTRWMV